MTTPPEKLMDKETLLPLAEELAFAMDGVLKPNDRHIGIARYLIRRGYTRSPAEVNGNTSDGYHTFNELYDHRCLLWINLCAFVPNTYVVENHFDGWFLLGAETAIGQVSYHCPNKFLHLVKAIERRHPEFDGHTSADVIKRLKLLADYVNGEKKERV